MSEKSPVAISPANLPTRVGSSYPKPHDEACKDREKRSLGDVFGLSDYGVNFVRLPPGSWSSQRHWHSAEDEFLYVLEGKPTLITDRGETELAAGMFAGFKAGVADGHHLVNNTDETVVYIEVGSRKESDEVWYSDIDMCALHRNEGGTFTKRDGSPFS